MNRIKSNRINSLGWLIGSCAVFVMAVMTAGMTGCVEREVVYVRSPQGAPPPQPEPLPNPNPTGYPAAPGPGPAPAPVPAAGAPQGPVDPAIQQLVAPIALYPDALLAEVLAASTYPQQVIQANQWVRANPGMPDSVIDSQPWDPSVRALVHYPTVLEYMAADPAWMNALGAAFTDRRTEVMEAVQDLRAQAAAMGNLRDTPQEIVIVDDGVYYIEPADPNVIYVPSYDPVLVYDSPFVITYGVWYPGGIWLGFGFDWYAHGFYYDGWHDWHRDWIRGPHGWGRGPYFHSGFRDWHRDDRWGGPPHEAFRHDYGVRGGYGRADFHRDSSHSFHPAPSRRGGGGGEHGGGGHR